MRQQGLIWGVDGERAGLIWVSPSPTSRLGLPARAIAECLLFWKLVLSIPEPPGATPTPSGSDGAPPPPQPSYLQTFGLLEAWGKNVAGKPAGSAGEKRFLLGALEPWSRDGTTSGTQGSQVTLKSA